MTFLKLICTQSREVEIRKDMLSFNPSDNHELSGAIMQMHIIIKENLPKSGLGRLGRTQSKIERKQKEI